MTALTRSTFGGGSQPVRQFTPQDCREPAIARLYVYWLEKRGSRRFPARPDLDPIEMRYALGNITMFDIVATPTGPRFRYRLIGSDIVARDGFDFTGRWLDDLPLPQYRDLLMSRLVQLMPDPSPLLVRNTQFYDDRWLDYEAIWLPLAADGETPNILMTCQIFNRMPSSHTGPLLGNA